MPAPGNEMAVGIHPKIAGAKYDLYEPVLRPLLILPCTTLWPSVL